MSLTLTIFGFAVAFVGILGTLNPERVHELVSAGNTHQRFQSAVVFRMFFGTILIAAAPTCHSPATITWLGVALLVGAVGLWGLGEKRFEGFTDWWSRRPAITLRAVSVVAFAFGVFLFYAPA